MATHGHRFSEQKRHVFEAPVKPSRSKKSATTYKKNENQSHLTKQSLTAEVINAPESHEDEFKYTIIETTQADLKARIVNSYQIAIAEYGQDMKSIKEFVLEEVGPYLLDVDIADKRLDQALDLLMSAQAPSIQNNKYFAITNLFAKIKAAPKSMQTKTERIVNKVFADLKSLSANIESLRKAKEIELQTGFPILSGFLDMYSRDRIANAFNINASFNRRYDVNRWFNDNLFARYVS
eukprot:745358_1